MVFRTSAEIRQRLEATNHHAEQLARPPVLRSSRVPFEVLGEITEKLTIRRWPDIRELRRLRSSRHGISPLKALRRSGRTIL